VAAIMASQAQCLTFLVRPKCIPMRISRPGGDGNRDLARGIAFAGSPAGETNR
jgi:hypothetical protein